MVRQMWQFRGFLVQASFDTQEYLIYFNTRVQSQPTHTAKSSYRRQVLTSLISRTPVAWPELQWGHEFPIVQEIALRKEGHSLTKSPRNLLQEDGNSFSIASILCLLNRYPESHPSTYRNHYSPSRCPSQCPTKGSFPLLLQRSGVKREALRYHLFKHPRYQFILPDKNVERTSQAGSPQRAQRSPCLVTSQSSSKQLYEWQ